MANTSKIVLRYFWGVSFVSFKFILFVYPIGYFFKGWGFGALNLEPCATGFWYLINNVRLPFSVKKDRMITQHRNLK